MQKRWFDSGKGFNGMYFKYNFRNRQCFARFVDFLRVTTNDNESEKLVRNAYQNNPLNLSSVCVKFHKTAQSNKEVFVHALIDKIWMQLKERSKEATSKSEPSLINSMSTPSLNVSGGILQANLSVCASSSGPAKSSSSGPKTPEVNRTQGKKFLVE